jgi:hypothetical protein
MARAVVALGVVTLLAACSGPPSYRAPMAAAPPPDAFTACRASLSGLGAMYESMSPVRTREGCGFDEGVKISATPSRLNQPAVLSCPTALALSRFDSEVVQPAALRHFGKPVTRIVHVGAYSCRGIGGGKKWSQHAFGNAIDVIGFDLADGSRIVIAKDWRGAKARTDFLREVAQGACAVFQVVLTPAYDKSHHDHFHLDSGPERLCAI